MSYQQGNGPRLRTKRLDPRPRHHTYRPKNMLDGRECTVCGKFKRPHMPAWWRVLHWWGLVS
jgi:hypothetical protein